jgi:hypothetical protein
MDEIIISAINEACMHTYESIFNHVSNDETT